MTDAPDTTLLIIEGVGLPLYSARGLKQSLVPIEAATAQRRTINGALVNTVAPGFQKYKSVISGSDQQPPALDGIWPGLEVTVSCLTELAFEGSEPDRPAVAGSVRSDSGSMFYRPILTMLITSYSVERDEWGEVVDWEIDLEEV